MGTAVSVLLMALGLAAPPSDVYVLNDPNIEIPITVLDSKRAELSELNLFMSDNQGRTWKKVATSKPDEKYFRFNVRNDGLYHFVLQSVDKAGVADPVDASKAPKVTKIQIDTRPSSTPEQSAPPAPTTPAEPAPPPPAFAPINPVVTPPAGVTQANSLTPPAPVAPIAPIAPPPMMQPAPAEQPSPAVPTPAAAPPAPLPPPPSNDGPSPLTPLAPQKPSIDPSPKPIASPAPSPAPVPATAAEAPARAPLIQHVRDQQVALDFEVERKGPSGVKKIETWMTHDDGVSWQKWSDTFETLSPVQIMLPGAEGTYGFRMVLYSGVMQSVGPPRRGDEPDVKLHVDRTPPVVAYYQPVPDPSHPNAITLRYSVVDANLDAASVVLQWSRQPNAGWQAIAPANVRPMPSSGIAGMSEGSWHLTPDVPDTVYLRITARDKAGNVGEFVTREPVTLDLNKPTARIKAVLPASARR